MVGLIFVLAYYCGKMNACEIREDKFPGILIFLLAPLIVVFLFSITTYKMPEKVFQHWIKFAQWATPLLMIITFLILGGGNNGMGVEGVIGGVFDAFSIGFFYVLFVGISIWRIVSARKK